MNFSPGSLLLLLIWVSSVTLASPSHDGVIKDYDNNHLYERIEWRDLKDPIHLNTTDEGSAHVRRGDWEDLGKKIRGYSVKYACLGGILAKSKDARDYAEMACHHLVTNSKYSVPIGAGWESYRIFNQMTRGLEKMSITYRFRGQDVRGEHSKTAPDLDADICKELMKILTQDKWECADGGQTRGATLKLDAMTEEEIIKANKDKPEQEKIGNLQMGFDPNAQKENVFEDYGGNYGKDSEGCKI
ncbi:hypothetical protein FQN54_007567 [Arachnomyces sp. PD_36]|nr:hypothetical protein FQN54_007567 [Arachnomyces sp. PD_36]